MPLTDSQIQTAFAQWTLDMEARRDAKGRLVVYPLPAGDGGGAFEVAGINERYHPQMANRLKRLIEQGDHAQAEIEARDYLSGYTDAVDEWHPNEIVEGFLRCCAFNRGPKGAAWILQYALTEAFAPSLYTLRLDGIYGTGTQRAAYSREASNPTKMLAALYGARIVYERTALPWKGGRDEDSIFWHGLFRRFTDDVDFALSLASP